MPNQPLPLHSLESAPSVRPPSPLTGHNGMVSYTEKTGLVSVGDETLALVLLTAGGDLMFTLLFLPLLVHAVLWYPYSLQDTSLYISQVVELYPVHPVFVFNIKFHSCCF
jgi:hypothetical protein